MANVRSSALKQTAPVLMKRWFLQDAVARLCAVPGGEVCRGRPKPRPAGPPEQSPCQLHPTVLHTSKNTKAITADKQEGKLPPKTRTLLPPRRKPSGDTVPVTDGSALVLSVQLEPSYSSCWTSQTQAAEPSCQSKGTS
ncbi:hypothetical protein MHYP_G00046670 [Metynnis hypsauchen]